MARFLFLSYGAWGHIDFGGRSFVRTASALAASHHEVWWTTASQDEPRAIEYLKTLSFNYVKVADRLALLGRPSPEDARKSVELLAAWICQARIDVLVADRVCRYALLVAKVSGIPWAAMGTDGRPWRRVPRGSALVIDHNTSENSMRPTCEQLKIQSVADSYLATDWGISEYLNISFFPRIIYRDQWNDHWPPHSHFVGCSTEVKPSFDRRDRVLVVLGNTMAPSAVESLVRALPAIRHDALGLEILIATGSSELTERLEGAFETNSRLRVTTWVNYSEASLGARLLIGHGGTAVTWEAIRNGIPFLAIAPSYGDQCFLSRQMVELGAGRILAVDDIQPKLGDTMESMLASDSLAHSMQHLQKLALAGGGVRASVALLGALAARRAPVDSCPETPCCC
jgi:UDP:flavonoid glycosyltransferase YjiC (YdhE family)